MSLHVISCHMHNECYMDNTNHTTYRVSWIITSPAYDFHKLFHSCQHITMIISFSKPCAFLWVADFWCPTVGSTNQDTFTAFHRWGLCLTIIGGFFTRGGIYPFLLIPDTYFLYHFIQPFDYVGCCPIYQAHPIKHQTQYRFTNHALTPI